MKPTLLVLAAGMGSRYGGLKQLDKLGPSGETIMEYSIYDAIRAGFGKVVFVIRKTFEKEFKEQFIHKIKDKIKVDFVFQDLNDVPDGHTFAKEREKPWGTGHAVWVARNVINEPFAVINADDFYGANAYKVMAQYLINIFNEGKDEFALNGYFLKDTLSEFGTVSRGICKINDSKYLTEVVERTSIKRNGETIEFKSNDDKWYSLKENDIVSMNFWGFTPSYFKYATALFKEFIEQNSNNLKAEFYIPTVVDRLYKMGKVNTKVIEANEKWFGVTYQEDRPTTVQKISELVNEGKYPLNLWA